MKSRLAALFLTAFVIAAWTGVRAGEPEPLPVGIIYDMSGFDALIAKEGRRGAELAVKLVNAKGGIHGRKLKPVFRDMGGALDMDETVNQIIGRENVQALVGLNDSDAALVAGPAAAARGIPLVTAGCTLTGLASEVGDCLYAAAFDNTAQARAMAEFAVKSLGYAKTVILHCPATDSERNLYETLLKAVPEAGGEVVFHAEVDDTGSELAVDMEELSHFSKIMEAVFIIAPPDPAVRALSALRLAGLDQAVVGSAGMDFPGIEEAVGNSTGQIFFVSMADLNGPRPEAGLFSQRYAEAYGEPPSSGFAAVGFDAASLLVNAISRTPTPNRKTIRHALEGIRTFSGVSGTFTYKRGTRVPEKTVYIMGVQNGAKTLASAFDPQ